MEPPSATILAAAASSSSRGVASRPRSRTGHRLRRDEFRASDRSKLGTACSGPRVSHGRHLQPDDVGFRALSLSGKLQRRVQARIDELVASGDEIGLQVAVTVEGRMVAVAVVADQRTGEPVTPSTLFFATS